MSHTAVANGQGLQDIRIWNHATCGDTDTVGKKKSCSNGLTFKPWSSCKIQLLRSNLSPAAGLVESYKTGFDSRCYSIFIQFDLPRLHSDYFTFEPHGQKLICCSNTNFSLKSLTKHILLLPQDVCTFCFLSNLELLYDPFYKPSYNSTTTPWGTTTPGCESLLYITLKALRVSSYCHWHLFSSLLSSRLLGEHIVTSPSPWWRAP